MQTKSLQNTDQDAAKKNVSDLVVFGGDLFKLLSKASSKNEGWMKSTKAMDVGCGCVIQVTTQQLNDTGMHNGFDKGGNPLSDWSHANKLLNSVIAEALTYVPGVKLQEDKNAEGEVIGRSLVPIS